MKETKEESYTFESIGNHLVTDIPFDNMIRLIEARKKSGVIEFKVGGRTVHLINTELSNKKRKAIFKSITDEFNNDIAKMCERLIANQTEEEA